MDESTYVVVMLLVVAYDQVMSSELIEIIQFDYFIFFTHSLTQSLISTKYTIINLSYYHYHYYN